jgi:RHS repeat-associated protein
LPFNPTTFKGSTLTQNADNQFLSGDFGMNWLFDGNGSPTTYKGSNLTFDIENRLVNIASPAFAAAYAPDDRRASKTAAGATTYYLYDEDGGASPLLEESYSGSSATVSMGYGMAEDGLRARYAPSSGGLYYLFQWDPQGSLVQRQTGGPGGNTSYDALDTAMFDGYGAKLGDTDAFTGGAEPTRDAMGFQGQFGAYTDNETGLVLMGHRYYDAGTGRFLTRDPLGYGGGINLYGFTGNNPVNESDPDGTFAEGQPTVDPLDPSIERAIEEAGRVSRIVIRPVGLGALRIVGGSVGLFFMSQTRVADSSTGRGSVYWKKNKERIIAFNRAGGSLWTDLIYFNGNRVYQRDDLIQPTKSNISLMKGGNAPYGPDGNPIVLHHMLQQQDGALAEVTMTFHRKNFKALHINMPSKSFPSGIDRDAFDAWKEKYWMSRAKDFEK